MASWRFPPLRDGFDYLGAMQALASEDVRPVKDQHVVSKVVLKGFASRSARQGWQLARYDKLRRQELDPKGLNACGKIPEFIQYASGSAELLWHNVENRLDAAIRSTESGTLHADEMHVRTIKDGIALHLVRSPHYHRVHERSFIEAVHALRIEVLQNKQAMLAKEFRRRYGLDAAGLESLELLLRQYLEPWEEYERNGELLRVTMEQNYYRVCSVLDDLAVEVLHAPLGNEFIISDSPAFTFRTNPDGTMSVRMAIGDSHGIGLPITRKSFVAIGPESKNVEVSPDLVEQLNRIQVELAERQLYYRPGNRAKGLIDAVLIK
jgi:hypothetical protein